MCIENKAILHITNDYAGSKVYKNLVQELDNLGLRQIVYTAIRESNKIGVNEIQFQSKVSEIIYSHIINWHVDRLFYPFKIFKILKDIQIKVDFNKIQCIHAHTWYTDGGVAYFLSKKYNIPFFITVRNTDLNIFQKKLIYLRSFGRKILSRAQQVILISESYKKRVINQKSLLKIESQLYRKIRVIPNGVDSYWIRNNLVQSKNVRKDILNVLYVGNFTYGKQVVNLQQAVVLLNYDQQQKVRLHLVGGGGKDEPKVLKLVEEYPDSFTFHGKIYDKAVLKKIYQRCDFFAMPSRHETFGLVYIEAMLQGLPILYSEGEGIDGFYSEKIGEKVRIHNINEIKEKLKIMTNTLEQYSIPLEKIKKNHDWALIAKKYKKIYDSCIK